MYSGAPRGWLIDPLTRRVYVYLPQTQPHILEPPSAVSADSLPPSFGLDLRMTWGPDL